MSKVMDFLSRMLLSVVWAVFVVVMCVMMYTLFMYVTNGG